MQKRVATVRNKTMVRMESALALWINDRRKNITLDTDVICKKLKRSIKPLLTAMTFVIGKRRRMRIPGHRRVLFTQYQAHLMPARAGLINLRNALNLKMFARRPSANTTGAEAFVNNKFKVIIEEG